MSFFSSRFMPILIPILAIFNMSTSIWVWGLASIFGVIVGDYNSPSYQFVWRLLMGFPIVISIIQSLLLLFIFKSESPLFYKIKLQQNNEISAFKLIYKNPQLAFKYLSNEDSLSMSVSSVDPKQRMQILKDPKRFIDLFKPQFRSAFLVGCTL